MLDPQVPQDPAQLGNWLARNVLRPSMPLFDEARRVVHEDPRIRDAAAYSSVLAAVAAGESSPTKIGGLLSRPATSLAHQLTTLASAGFINRRHDMLLDRRPVITVADPMVRLHQLVIEPYLADLEAGRARQVWAEAGHTAESKIFGPHFEALAAEWVARYAPGEAGLAVGPVGQTVIACREHKVSHEIDVLALARGSRPRSPGTPVAFVGEAKHRDRHPGLAELRRLQHLRDLLTASGHDAADATLACSVRQASPMNWQPKRPSAKARFSWPHWTISIASRHERSALSVSLSQTGRTVSALAGRLAADLTVARCPERGGQVRSQRGQT